MTEQEMRLVLRMALIEANKLNMANALAELKSLKEVCHFFSVASQPSNKNPIPCRTENCKNVFFFVQAEEQKIREEREKADAERRELATAARVQQEETGGEHNKGFLIFVCSVNYFQCIVPLACTINF